jgi:regulator of sigma E protease
MNQPAAGNNGLPPEAADSAPRTESDPRRFNQLVTLALLAVGLWALFQYFGIEGMISVALVAIGLGLVIFIHELGHFAVAKWCDVHVETFSIGFGPAIPGCSFRRGDTLYKIAWFPLGGYVKMVGEGNESEEYGEDYPRSFKNKSVGQRMAIISAGVIMNVVFGFLCFILVYPTHGVERPPGVIDLVDSGSPAWHNGARSGAVIDQIGDVKNPYFDDLKFSVMLSSAGEYLPFVFHQPGQPPTSTKILPRLEEDDLHPMIGLSFPMELKLIPKPRKVYLAPVLHDGAAAQAKPAFEFGDEIVGTTDPENPAQVKPLPPDPRNPDSGLSDYFEFQRRMRLLAGKPVVIEVRRRGTKTNETPTEVQIQVPPAYHSSFGLRMQIGHVTAVRNNSPVQARDLAKGIDGDLITEVEIADSDGHKTRYVTSRGEVKTEKGVTVLDLDPIRLPDQLEKWAQRQTGPKKVVHLKVSRQVPHDKPKEFPLELEWDDSWASNREVPLSRRSPQSIPALGLAYQVETTVDGVAESSPAALAGIQRLDVIKTVRFMNPAKEPGQRVSGKLFKLESDQWAHVAWLLQETEFKEATLYVERAKQTQEYQLFAVEDRTWPLDERGLIFLPQVQIQKAHSLGQAVVLGLERTYRSIVQIYLNLKAMVTGRISVKTVGGPIMIATVAYEVASENVYTFLLFLGMISINLAVINFLPIPILDGGHMVFLLWEKIKGGPVSEAVRIYASVVGLTVILALVVFTFWVDIARLFKNP